MNFKQTRLLRELKKKYAYDLLTGKSLVEDFSEEEVLEMLMAMELNSSIVDTVNKFLDIGGNEVTVRMMANVLGASLGTILGKVSSGNKVLADNIQNEVTKIIQQFRSKNERE